MISEGSVWNMMSWAEEWDSSFNWLWEYLLKRTHNWYAVIISCKPLTD